VRIIAFVLVALALVAGTPAWAQAPRPLSTIQGQVTAVGQYSFQLDGKAYVLAGDLAPADRALLVQGANVTIGFYLAEDGIAIVRQISKR
jgi:hypothetical protein